jgi:hypothetical protein
MVAKRRKEIGQTDCIAVLAISITSFMEKPLVAAVGLMLI